MLSVKILAVSAATALAFSTGMFAHPSSIAPEQPLQASEQLDAQAEADGSQVFSSEAMELPVRPAERTTANAAELAILAPTIRCSLGVHNPHGSHHVRGTINGTANIECKGGTAGALKIHYSLIRTSPKPKQWGAEPKSNAKKKTISVNRAVNCSEGPADFRGWAQGEITPPAGYKLDGPVIQKKYGKIVGVACGTTTFMAPADDDLASETTVTFIREDLAQ